MSEKWNWPYQQAHTFYTWCHWLYETCLCGSLELKIQGAWHHPRSTAVLVKRKQRVIFTKTAEEITLKELKLYWNEHLFMKVSDVFLQIAFQFGSTGTKWTLELRLPSTLFSLMSYQWCLPSILFITWIAFKPFHARYRLTISCNTITFRLPFLICFWLKTCSCKETK